MKTTGFLIYLWNRLLNIKMNGKRDKGYSVEWTTKSYWLKKYNNK